MIFIDNTIYDTNIPMPKAFVKLGKLEYMVKYIDNGDLRFAPAYEFSHMREGNDKIADKFEGSLFYPVSKIYAAPLLSDDKDGVVFGKPFKIADTGIQRTTSTTIQHIPFHCLYCYNNPPMNAVVRLDNYDQITKEFPDYDAAVIIYDPLAFLKRLERYFEIYANYVKYTDSTPSVDDLKNQIHCLYYKRTAFKEQNEFRIALPKLKIKEPEIYQIGSLLNIAYCLPLRHLKHGVIIANNDADFECLKTRCQEAGFGVGDCSKFTD